MCCGHTFYYICTNKFSNIMSTDNSNFENYLPHEPDGTGNGKMHSSGGTYKKRFDLPAFLKDHFDQVAKRLPLGPEEYDTENLVSGRTLLEQGTTEVKRNGLIVPVVPDKDYALPAVALRPITHSTKLRQFWRAGGLLGCVDYINRLPEYLQHMQGLYPSLFDPKDGTFLGVKEGTQLLPDPTYMARVKASKQIVQSN